MIHLLSKFSQSRQTYLALAFLSGLLLTGLTTPALQAQAQFAILSQVQHDVPFTTQAPMGEWQDPRQRDGCEEASIIMAMMWVRGQAAPREEVRRDIINLSEYERAIFGFYHDTSAADTARIMREYYNHQNVMVKENINVNDIQAELSQGRVVLVPLNTRLLGSPLYRNGPVRHTIIVTGYNGQTEQFIAHDPLFNNGKNLTFKAPALNNALWNYSSGIHRPLGSRTTALVSIGR